MKCQRCNGLMHPVELRDRRAHGRSPALVCLMCGEIVDPVIADNRVKSPQELALMLPPKSTRRRSRFRHFATR